MNLQSDETLYFTGKGSISNVTEIKANKTSVKRIHIGNEISGIEISFYDIFTEFKSFDVSSENKQFQSIVDILFSKDAKTLISCPPKKEVTIYEIPSTVETIKINAFYNVKTLTTIIIPSSVKSIGDKAFRECKSLETIIFKGTSQPNPCSTIAFDENKIVKVVKEYKENKFCGLNITGNENKDNGTNTNKDNGNNTNKDNGTNGNKNNNGTSFIFILMILNILLLI